MNSNMRILESLRAMNKLKGVYRANSVDTRKESTAEHSWSCLILADFLIDKTHLEIDRLKVYELLIYHDLIEISAGDTPLTPWGKTKESVSASKLEEVSAKLPQTDAKRYKRLYKEFLEQKTVESRFAKLVDSLDAVIQELDYKADWGGWTKQFFIENKGEYFAPFPELKPFFESLLDYLEKNKYFEKTNYLMRGNEINNLPRSYGRGFNKQFGLFTKPFMDERNFDSKLGNARYVRDNQKATYVVGNEQGNLYDGSLWEDEDVEMIANMDYMYCLPSWDWWINPIFPASKYRKEYLSHVTGKNGYSVIFTNNNKKRENQFTKTIQREGFTLIDIGRQYEKNPIEYFIFYDYYRVLMPLKFAQGINRIKKDIEQTRPSKIHFVLRGGYLLAEILGYGESRNIYIDPNSFKKNLSGEYIVDDCIVMTRTVEKLGLNSKSSFTLSCLDCAVPQDLYAKKYPKAKLNLPTELINLFPTRIFEKNPLLIGLDVVDGKFIYSNNSVRRRFVDEVQASRKIKGLDELVLSMAHNIFNYREVGPNDARLEKLRRV